MAVKNSFLKILFSVIKLFFSVKENLSNNLGEISSVLIIRQHNQLGDVLVGTSFVRAIKEKYPDAEINFVLSPQNYKALVGNKNINSFFVFDKKKLFNISYLLSYIKYLRKGYDCCFVPVTVSISFTSNFIARISKCKIRVGANSLNGEINTSNFLFDRRVDLDWRKYPDSHYADRILDLIRPFGFDTKNFNTEIFFDEVHLKEAERFISSIKRKSEKSYGNNTENKIIGIHPGAGKPQNIWNLDKVITLIEKLKSDYCYNLYIEGTDADKNEMDYIKARSLIEIHEFRNKSIQETAALIELSDLFITTDTGTMHIAGSTKTAVISLFGPTNPYNWAPIGENKYFIRKSDLIDDIEVEDVIKLVQKILTNY
jgi:ADP-heptose:LPS heptosyltransferase